MFMGFLPTCMSVYQHGCLAPAEVFESLELKEQMVVSWEPDKGALEEQLGF